jgi:hypothetical protein
MGFLRPLLGFAILPHQRNSEERVRLKAKNKIKEI